MLCSKLRGSPCFPLIEFSLVQGQFSLLCSHVLLNFLSFFISVNLLGLHSLIYQMRGLIFSESDSETGP